MEVSGIGAGSAPAVQEPQVENNPPKAIDKPEEKAPVQEAGGPPANTGQKLAEFKSTGEVNKAKIETSLVAKINAADAAGPNGGIGGALRDLDSATKKLNEEKGEEAAKILKEAAGRARLDAAASKKAGEAAVLSNLANNFDARANAYTQSTPKTSKDAAINLSREGWKAIDAADILEKQGLKDEAKLLRGIGEDSKLQAQLTYQSAVNTDVLMGKAVSNTYEKIVNASFDREIAQASDWKLWRDKSPAQALRDDKAKMATVFKEINRTMEEKGISFDRAWHDMIDDNKIDGWGVPQKVPGFATRNDAAMFLKEHKVTRGLLAPMADFAGALSEGNQKKAENAQVDIVKTLRDNNQWEISKQVLSGLQENAKTPEAKAEADRLTANQGWEKFKAKSAKFIADEGPTLILSGLVSGGVGSVVKGLATAAKMSSTAVKLAGVTAEIGSFVPTEKILNEALNGKKGDWSASALAKDYAFTIGGYGLFKALGKGWEVLKGRGTAKPFETPKIEGPGTPKVEGQVPLKTETPKITQGAPKIEGGEIPSFKNYDDLVKNEWFGKQVKKGDKLPDGYEWYGNKIRRARGKAEENFAKLGLDDAGRIMLAESSGRLSIPSVMKSNFKAQLANDIKAANPSFTNKQVADAVAKEMERVQIHHIIPDEVVKNSELGKAAVEAGYNLDRASNLKGLANSAANLKPGESVAHWSSHPKYSQMVRDEVDAVTRQLIKDHGSLKAVPKEKLFESMKQIEEKFLKLINDGKVPKTPEGRLSFAPTLRQEVYA